MSKNYFPLSSFAKSAWRNIVKHKGFSLINIAGLSIGIAVCFTILMYVKDELSYDRYNKNADRIVRIEFNALMNGGKIAEAGVMAPVAQTMKKDFPEVEDATRILSIGAPKVIYKGETFKDHEMVLVDPNFFSVFTLPLLAGNAATALSQPNTVVITKETAKKYFGDEDPIGKTLGMNNNAEAYKVTGVIDKVPDNSHFHFDMFGSMLGLEQAKGDSWMTGSYYTYLLLKNGVDYRSLSAKLPPMVEKYMGPQIQKEMGLSLQQFRTKGNQLGFVLQPLTKIHLHPNTTTEFEAGGSESYVYIFGGIAIFMLLIACINFINLSTASATNRSKEVGVRKVIGSSKGQLIKQFLLESAIIVFIALVISYFIILVTLPAFNNITGKSIKFGLDWTVLITFLGFGILVSVVAGLYPAFFLSSFKPIAVLKGAHTGNNRSFGLRSGLVVFQFFISVGLIVSTIVVWQQMKYIQKKNLGYNKEQLLVISNSYALGHNEETFKQSLLQDPRIVNVTVSGYKPAGPSFNNNSMSYPAGHDDQAMTSLEYHIDEQYIPTMGMTMSAGRNFSKEYKTDSSGIIINETAAKAFGWKNSTAIGQSIVRINDERGNHIPYKVIGVVKDFHFKSLHQPITPLLMRLDPETGLIVKVKTDAIQDLLATMKKSWDAYGPDEPFAYSFMDELYNKTYTAEQKTGTILNVFAILTILVACLGLYGLATYTAEQRRKEIGIRKVLGATAFNLTRMLSKDFIKLVAIACLIAFPLSYWAMTKWLQSFAYRIEIGYWIFILAAVLALLIALVTISFQAVKAALVNPVRSLRAE